MAQRRSLQQEKRRSPRLDRRRFPRNPLRLPIVFSGDLIEAKGIVFNISPEGCAIASGEKVRKGLYLSLYLRLPHEDMPIKIELAVVRWVKKDRFGLDFIRTHPAQKARLSQLSKFLDMIPKRRVKIIM